MPATKPPVIPEPFAQGGDFTVIPDTTGSPGRASWSLGFPPVTMEAEIAGGIPPDGRDFNGLGNALSANLFYIQAGQPYVYDVNISTAVGGYGLGAVIGSSDGATLWYNTLNGNTVNPDGAGTNWVSAFTYGSITISGLTGGTRTLTRLESRFGLLVLSGALVSNQAVILPNDITNWRIVNTTTGAFTVTVRTGGGIGVPVPQGDFSTSVGVYGNGTDIFLDVPPVSLPIAVTPDPNTLVKRDNVGNAFANYFNGATAVETPTVANVIVTNNSDGYFRKIGIDNFSAQLFLNELGGQVTNGQVPASAVLQFFSQSLGSSGFVKLPGGIIIQWGSHTFGDLASGSYANVATITFPEAFPNAVWQIIPGRIGDATNTSAGARSPTLTNFQLYMEEWINSTQGASCGASWIAIGN